MNIGKSIRNMRGVLNYSQEYMADKLGLTQSAYSKIESGNTDIPFSKLVEIASILGHTVEEVIGFNENFVFNLTHNKTAQALVINQMSENEKKVYEEYIESLKIENAYLKGMIDKLLDKK